LVTTGTCYCFTLEQVQPHFAENKGQTYIQFLQQQQKKRGGEALTLDIPLSNTFEIS
jgi:hypothetical protein